MFRIIYFYFQNKHFVDWACFKASQPHALKHAQLLKKQKTLKEAQIYSNT